MTKKKTPAEKLQAKNADRLKTFIKQLDTELIGILVGESDRGCVLVSGGFIEEGLEHYIRRHLRSVSTDIEGAEWLLTQKPQPAFGSFHARIVACSSLGLIDEHFRDALFSLKALRNSLAHRDPDNPMPALSSEDGMEILRHFRGVFNRDDVVRVHAEVSEKIRHHLLESGTSKLRGIEADFVELPADFQKSYHNRFVDAELSRLQERVPFICAVLLILQRLQEGHSLDHL